ncbi:MAG TPA: hypothetical protein VND93_29475 [Myxococcales bacterium]|nr:hypothetical protein [Myxococcales bacterium]
MLRSFRHSISGALLATALLGPAVAHAHCIDFDGNKVCAGHDHDSDVPPVTGKPVETSTETYHAPPSPPPSEPKEKEPEPSKPSEHEHKFVKH